MANTNEKCFPEAYHIQLIPKADSTTRLLDSCTLANLPEPIPFIERSTSQEFNTPDEAALNWSLIFNNSSKAPVKYRLILLKQSEENITL